MSGVVVMTYVLPMLLGQTYDIAKNLPGIHIYNASTFQNSEVIENYFTNSQYRLVDTSDDVKNFLDVHGKLSLKAKAGMVDLEGEGNYLKERAKRSHSIEILIKVNFQTITRTIRSSWTPDIDWTLQDARFMGNHYCRSITYGGELIASVRFLATNQFDKEKIKGAIQAELNVKTLESELQGKLEMLQEQLDDTTSMEIRYYATVPIPGISHDIQGLMKLVDEFPAHVKSVNKGLGNPLRMELYPLASLENSLKTRSENKALNDHLEDMEDQFDDLLTTRRDVLLWINDLPPTMPQSVGEKVSNFIEKLENLIGVYTQAIADLDLASDEAVKTFEEIFSAYRDNGTLVPNKFSRKLRALQKEVYNEAPDLEAKNGGAMYVHWGRSTCEKHEETVVEGISVSTRNKKGEGSSAFHCMPWEATQSSSYVKELEIQQDIADEDEVTMVPLIYNGQLENFQNVFNRPLPCAVCRAQRSTAANVFHGLVNCPANWTLTYDGYVMTSAPTERKGNYICVDKSMDVTDVEDLPPESPELMEVTIKCGALPCGPYKNFVPVKCAVCKR